MVDVKILDYDLRIFRINLMESSVIIMIIPVFFFNTQISANGNHIYHIFALKCHPRNIALLFRPQSVFATQKKSAEIVIFDLNQLLAV